MNDAQQFAKAVDLFQKGDVAAAEKALRPLGGVKSSQPDVLHFSAVLSMDSGNFPQAIRCFERLLDIVGRPLDLLKSLAVAYQNNGQLDLAIEIAREIVQREPNSLNDLFNLAFMVRESGAAREAIVLFEDVIQLDKNFADAYYGLGRAALDITDTATACRALEEAVRLVPEDGEAMFWHARALHESGNWPRAIDRLRQVIALQPNFIEAHCDLGKLLADSGDVTEAMRVYESVLRIDPQCADAHNGLGTLQWAFGRKAAAEKSFRAALASDQNMIIAHANIVELKRFSEFDGDAVALEAQLNRLQQDDPRGIPLGFALGKVHDDIGNAVQAFEHFAAANQLFRRNLVYDIADDETLVDGLVSWFDEKNVAECAGGGCAAQNPIFILGMPRSATTLVEQIIASHSAVHGAGELDFFENLLSHYGTGRTHNLSLLDAVSRLDRTVLTKIGEDYSASLQQLAPDTVRYVTDKMPTNFLFLGAIVLALPNARIVHCVRDPVDVCLSNFKRLFLTGHPYSYDLVELGRFYNAYRKIMNHWHMLFPNRFIEIVYEDLVADPEPETRRLIERCGLEWEDACLAFHETERPVFTNPEGVRRPIYTESVKRWKKYEQHLGPLLEVLALA